MDELLTMVEVRKILGVSKTQLYKMLGDKEGEIKSFLISPRERRVRASELDRFVNYRESLGAELVAA